MRTDTSLESRAAAAATAVEPLARALTITDEPRLSPVTVAYLVRLGQALARVEEAAALAEGVEPSARYWSPDVQTSAARAARPRRRPRP